MLCDRSFEQAPHFRFKPSLSLTPSDEIIGQTAKRRFELPLKFHDGVIHNLWLK